MKKEEFEKEKKSKGKGHKISFTLEGYEYDMFAMDSVRAGYKKTGSYAKKVVQDRAELKVIDSECIIDSTRKVGEAVDLAKGKLEEAERDPEAWKYEADMDIIRDLLDEVRRLQTELVKIVIDNLR